MFKSFAQLFIAITALFRAITRTCNSIDNAAHRLEIASEAFRDEGHILNRIKRAELEKQLESAPTPTKSTSDFEFK